MKTKLPPPAVLLIVGGFAWGIDWLLPDWRLPIAGLETLAGLLAGAAITLMVVAAWWVIRHRTTLNPIHPERASRLITSGPYQHSRNPIYLADMVLLVAWIVWLGNMASALTMPLFILYLNHFQIRPEERALALNFGEAYRTYCRQVRRWL
ncbi:MAG: isoprenylcysteine carboxylmethyltransferase family protein [Gammaproteobacteria bacterium]|nr:isoprenylcysteine carboxylmethyltransferase family protein [Gammaproteobacteria bacterium]